MSVRTAAFPRRKGVLATILLFSLGIHILGAVAAGFWVVARYLNSPPPVFEVRRDIRLPAQEREHRMNMAEFDGLTPKPSFTDKLSSARATAFSLPDLPRIPMDQLAVPDPSALMSEQISGLAGSAGLGGGGEGAGGLGGTGKGVSFFGIQDHAKSVVILIDVSDSMFTRTGDARGRTLVRRGSDQSFQAIREEAIRLIRDLSIQSRFGIIRWSGGAYSWRPQLVPATDRNKEEAIRHIRTEIDMKSAPPRNGRPGGTRHDYALEEAFRLQPETLFMLTDGNATSAAGGGLSAIPADDIWKVADEGQRSLRSPARLHVIYYLTGAEKEDEERMLRGLASKNGGQFRKTQASGRKDSSKRGR